MVSIWLLVRSLKEKSNNHTHNHIIIIIINLNYHLCSACPKYLFTEFNNNNKKKRSQKDKATWVQRKCGVDQRHFYKKSLNFKTKEQSIMSLHNTLPILRHTQLLAFQAIVITRYFTLFCFLTNTLRDLRNDNGATRQNVKQRPGLKNRCLTQIPI